ncbi:MAG: hypothetical protein CFK52_01050 [Chloracidobacterium sp. CP2_5A]|nr:MAG: hypothetical protein CFK52_01050 [Chloracidobacterium sp. CP2_5A]
MAMTMDDNFKQDDAPDMEQPWEDLLGYALGLLGEEERRRLEMVMAQDARLRVELLEETRSLIARVLSATATPPPAHLRERLMSAVQSGAMSPSRPAPAGDAAEAIYYSAISRADSARWFPLQDGWLARALYQNEVDDTVLALVRAMPGMAMPPHRHLKMEEILVLEGDLVIGDETLGPGDYIRSEAGTLHAHSYTATGCLILVRRSLAECQVS